MQQIKQLIRKALRAMGYKISRIPPPPETEAERAAACRRQLEEYSRRLAEHGITKVHYACGPRLFSGDWVNVDIVPVAPESEGVYAVADLAARHPFPGDFFRFAFNEDFLPHLGQGESMIFLSEAFRCLRPGGVLRLSFPGFRGILRDHFRASDFDGAATGIAEAYARWRYKHFYCEEALEVVARHIGFSRFEIVPYGKSQHPELCDLDYRVGQIGLNIYAELTK